MRLKQLVVAALMANCEQTGFSVRAASVKKKKTLFLERSNRSCYHSNSNQKSTPHSPISYLSIDPSHAQMQQNRYTPHASDHINSFRLEHNSINFFFFFFAAATFRFLPRPSTHHLSSASRTVKNKGTINYHVQLCTGLQRRREGGSGKHVSAVQAGLHPSSFTLGL